MQRIARRTDQTEIFGQLFHEMSNEDFDTAIDRMLALSEEEVESAPVVEKPLTRTAGC